MEHPYQLVMRPGHHGTRMYMITRAEELVFEYHNDEHLDLFFRKLLNYLNRDQRGMIALEDRIIKLQHDNKALSDLVRIALRKLVWACRGMKDKTERDYVVALVARFRKLLADLKGV